MSTMYAIVLAVLGLIAGWTTCMNHDSKRHFPFNVRKRGWVIIVAIVLCTIQTARETSETEADASYYRHRTLGQIDNEFGLRLWRARLQMLVTGRVLAIRDNATFSQDMGSSQPAPDPATRAAVELRSQSDAWTRVLGHVTWIQALLEREQFDPEIVSAFSGLCSRYEGYKASIAHTLSIPDPLQMRLVATEFYRRKLMDAGDEVERLGHESIDWEVARKLTGERQGLADVAWEYDELISRSKVSSKPAGSTPR